MKEFIYTGTSWAVQSFDPLASDEIPDSSNIGKISTRITNLAREWAIPHYDISKAGTSNLDRVSAFHNLNIRNKPLVWVYGEPLTDLEQITGLTKSELIKRTDWQSIRAECNRHCIDQIASLGVPVFLIGGASDIVDCTHSNIVMISSWQKWISQQSGLSVDNNNIYVTIDNQENYKIEYCWSAEIVHYWLHQNPKITPAPGLVDSIYSMFALWKKLEQAGLFYQVHPNYHCTELFAEYLKSDIKKFLLDFK